MNDVIELLLGVMIGALFGAAVVGIVVAGASKERELEAFRIGYRRGLEEREQ